VTPVTLEDEIMGRAGALRARERIGRGPIDSFHVLTRRGDDVATSAVWKRLASAAAAVPIFVWMVTLAPAALFDALVVALSGVAAWELGRLLERAGKRTSGWLGVIASAAVTSSFAVPGHAPALTLTIVILVVLALPLVTSSLSVEPAATTLLSVTYVGWLLGHAVLLRALPDGAWLVLFLVGVTWVGETAAYAIGSAVGRHRLAPLVSPGKTIEGAVAQALLSLVAAVGLGRWLLPGWPVWQVLAAGLLLGIVGQVGDLAESVIKRSVGTKDTGGLIPGHGGALDRLDGLLFNAPALFYLVALMEGHR
jgi:phosphatidate cytidylyltransferase